MKDKIHPKYVETTVRCACGFEYKTYSTRENIKLDICSQCHPFYTGKTKMIDTAGRVERFRRRFGETKGSKILTVKEKEKQAADQKADARRRVARKKITSTTKPKK